MRNLVFLLLLVSFPVLAGDTVEIEDKPAKNFYKAFKDIVKPTCEYDECRIEAPRFTCIKIFGLYNCTMRVKENGELTSITLMGGEKAKALYQARVEAEEVLCSDEYTDLPASTCNAVIKGVNCWRKLERRRGLDKVTYKCGITFR